MNDLREKLKLIKEGAVDEVLEESTLSLTLKNLHRIAYNSFQNVTSTGNFTKIQPNLLKMVKSCKTMDDINFLRKDKSQAKNVLSKLAKNKPQISTQCKEHINWLGTVYTDALNERAKEIQNNNK